MKNKLKDFSNEELLEELAKRKTLPQPLADPNFSALVTLVTDYVEDIQNDDDMEHWVFEAAIEAVYGHDIWNYLNARN